MENLKINYCTALPLMLLTLHDIIPTHVLETMRGKTEEDTEEDTVLHYTILHSFFTLAYTPHSLVHNKSSQQGRLDYAPISKCKFKSKSIIDTETNPDPTRLRFF